MNTTKKIAIKMLSLFCIMAVAQSAFCWGLKWPKNPFKGKTSITRKATEACKDYRSTRGTKIYLPKGVDNLHHRGSLPGQVEKIQKKLGNRQAIPPKQVWEEMARGPVDEIFYVDNVHVFVHMDQISLMRDLNSYALLQTPKQLAYIMEGGSLPGGRFYYLWDLPQGIAYYENTTVKKLDNEKFMLAQEVDETGNVQIVPVKGVEGFINPLRQPALDTALTLHADATPQEKFTSVTGIKPGEIHPNYQALRANLATFYFEFFEPGERIGTGKLKEKFNCIKSSLLGNYSFRSLPFEVKVYNSLGEVVTYPKGSILAIDHNLLVNFANYRAYGDDIRLNMEQAELNNYGILLYSTRIDVEDSFSDVQWEEEETAAQ